MRRNQARSTRLSVIVLGLFVVTPFLQGQAPAPKGEPVPVIDDWSHHHLIYSRPATPEQEAQVQRDPRYWHQQYRPQLQAISAEAESAVNPVRAGGGLTPGDWSQNLGTGAKVGATNYPAKFSLFTNTANCGSATTPDYVVYNTGLAGSGTQASVVAYDNLYTGCSGTVPSVYWAYNTSGQVLTSAILSADGTQVAFVQTSSGQAGLLILRWAASTTETVGNPGTPTSKPNANYPGCTAPCMTEVFLHDGLGVAVDDTTSSAYYDYNTDTAWVGDATGWLHKLTGVFKGTPTEVRSAPWPIHLNPGNPNALSSPVLDLTSGSVFASDLGGFLYSVSPSGTVTQSGQLDHGAVGEGPILDGTVGVVYFFSSSDGSAACGAGLACSAVYLLSAGFGPGATGTEAVVGTSVLLGNTPNPMYIGTFDQAYRNSVNGTGRLFVCGNTGLNPTLYQIPITAGVMGTPVLLTPLSPAAQKPPCSPVSDVYNPNGTFGAVERIFASVQNRGTPTACGASGCVMSFVSLPWAASTAFSAGQEILDSKGRVEVAITSGTTGAVMPGWGNGLGGSLLDGTVRWVNQGKITATTRAAWIASHAYTTTISILDSNGNVEVDTTHGTSAPTTPLWNTAPGGITSDGTVVWTNAGISSTFALKATGGTSGIIIDNTVSSGTLGTSQVYFSTLGNQACGTSGTGGCAVQASQSALK